MQTLMPDDELTHEGDLATWQTFSLAYYEPIRRALRLMGLRDEDADDLAHSFLTKAAEKDFLSTYKTHHDQEKKAGRTARFRTYLYRSLRNHTLDAHRKRKGRPNHQSLDSEVAASVAAEPEPTLGPDAVYALDVLHQAIGALRRHCERTGRPHLWVFFEERLLADEFRDRRCKSREELAAEFPDKSLQFVDNGLTTAKRAFRRFVLEVIPRGLREGTTSAERFDEWMATLRESNASQFNLLHTAYRVSPYVSPDSDESASANLVVRGAGVRAGAKPRSSYGELALVASDDELGVLLSFQLEQPISEWLDPKELIQFVPASSPLWTVPYRWPNPASKATGPDRPFSLLTLVEPTEVEAEALEAIDLIAVLERLKSLSKQLRRRTDHAMPEELAQLLYTTVNVTALLRRGAELHSIGNEALAENVRWFLTRPWFDDRLRPLFESGLLALAGPRTTGGSRRGEGCGLNGP